MHFSHQVFIADMTAAIVHTNTQSRAFYLQITPETLKFMYKSTHTHKTHV